MKSILFLCTGNYYRSRFAEYLFNDLAVKQALDWRSHSRGLALERGIYNVGAISKYAVLGLQERSINLGDRTRHPLALTEADLVSANRVIALDKTEHQPLVAERFPQWQDAVEYWMVSDLHATPYETALTQIEEKVRAAIASLSAI